jgi:hypothetical protein
VTTEEADAISKEIKMAMEKLFAETVTPTPKVEHHTQLFHAIQELTSTVMKEAGIFRQDKGPDTEKSNTDGTGPPQAT